MATKKTTASAPKAAKAAPKAAKAAPKAAKAKTAKAAAPRHPLARLKAAFGTKADLVAKIVGPLTAEGQDGESLKARLLRASNQKLLHLADVVETVNKKYGSRAKLVDAIGAATKHAKDKDYLAKLAKLPLPQLLDLGNSATRRAKQA